MNFKKVIFILAMLGLFMGSVFAQTKGNKRVHDSFGNWSFGAGINVVDDSGTEGKDFFNTKENWNVSNPYLVSVEYYFDNQWSIIASGSINKYVSGKNIDSTGVIVKGFAADYFAVDMATRFSFGDMFTSYNFDFYMFLGLGYNKIGGYKLDPFIVDRPIDIDIVPDEINEIPTDANGFYDFPEVGKMTINGGLGFNYWFAETLGLNFNFTGKVAVQSGKFESGPNSVSNQAQFSLGLVYFFKKNNNLD